MLSTQLSGFAGQYKLPPSYVAACRRRGEYLADLTAAGLAELGMDAPIELPGGLLLELGAVFQIGLWEFQGLRSYITCELPTFVDAIAEFRSRMVKEPTKFDTAESATLFRRVVDVWLVEFSCDSQSFFSADILVGAIDEDVLADAMAEFLWTHRHSGESLE